MNPNTHSLEVPPDENAAMIMNEQTFERATALEREASIYQNQSKTEEAFKGFNEAASLYRKLGKHAEAAFCFTSAAHCWHKGTGLQPLRKSATGYEEAANEAVKAGLYKYALERFLDAALLYEKEGDFGRYSACFYESHRTDSRVLWQLFVHGKKDKQESPEKVAGRERLLILGRWVINQINCLLWGYGERPFRTLGVALVVILGTAVAYALAGPRILVDGAAHSISFGEALYMSVITFTTVGFGDYVPLGWVRILAAQEALAGIFLSPLFRVGLTRRFLRMCR